MALSIKSEAADRLARDLAATTGESLTDAVTIALRERLEREQARRSIDVIGRLRRLSDEVRALPIVDDRCPDDIVGYDEHGFPK
jgi:antitoxin VapB